MNERQGKKILNAMQEQYSEALHQLEQLLQQSPSNYTALAQLLFLFRRVGQVEAGQGFLQTAQEHASRSAGIAGKQQADTILRCHAFKY